MKRRILALLLAALTLTMLTAAAFAADTQGAYNIRSETNYKLTASGTADSGFYPGADTFTLTCNVPGEQVLVMLLQGTEQIPTESTLQYIDQQANSSSVTFTLKPKALTAGTYTVYVSTSTQPLTKAGSFEYGEKPKIKLGDVNNDGTVGTLEDAVLVLQYVAELTDLSPDQMKAAKVTTEGTVPGLTDAVRIMQYAAGLISEF